MHKVELELVNLLKFWGFFLYFWNILYNFFFFLLVFFFSPSRGPDHAIV